MNIVEKLKKYLNYLIILVALFLSISLLRGILRTRESPKAIESKELEVSGLEEKNRQLKEMLQKVESDAFVEKQIRDQLGLSKEGEIVLVLPEAEVLRKLVPDLPQDEEELPDPIWKKWLKLFL